MERKIQSAKLKILTPKNVSGFRLQVSRRHRGFTLIELLVVIAIITLLAAALLAVLRLGRVRSRDAKRKGDLHQMQLALHLYYDEYGNFPITDGGGGGGGGGGGKGKKKGWEKNGKSKGTLPWQYSTDTDYWIGCNECYGDEDPESLRKFLPGVPRDPINNLSDPKTSGHYSYAYYSLTGEDYELLAQLEDPEDTSLCARRCWLSHEVAAGQAWCPPCPEPRQNASGYLYTDH